MKLKDGSIIFWVIKQLLKRPRFNELYRLHQSRTEPNFYYLLGPTTEYKTQILMNNEIKVSLAMQCLYETHGVEVTACYQAEPIKRKASGLPFYALWQIRGSMLDIQLAILCLRSQGFELISESDITPTNLR